MLSIPLGTGADNPDLLGRGRKDSTLGFIHPRHSPTTFNLALWDQVLFFDGRIESFGKTPGANGGDGLGIRTPDTPFGVADPAVGNNLVEAQAGFPVTSESELRGFVFEAGNDNNSVRTHLAARIGNYGIGKGELVPNNWFTEFQTAFKSSEGPETLITFLNIAQAIAAFERSQVFVNSPWKAYVEGDNHAISNSAKRGALLFYRSIDHGGAGCAECHSGDFFTDEQYHVIAVPQIGVGKGDGETGDDDFGRFRETGNPDDMYAFRTPSLLNIEVTGPYGHVGSYVTLEGMVRHILNPKEAFENYDYMQLDLNIKTTNTQSNTSKALAQLEENRIAGKPSLNTISLTNEQVDDLINFLLALTDPCVKSRSCLAPWIPDETDANPDGLRLDAVDKDGRPL
jgi:cytochrome c peroxidase